MSKPERDALDEFIHTIPVNIERLIKSQGIKLNTNARPEDFTKWKISGVYESKKTKMLSGSKLLPYLHSRGS